MFTHLVRIDKVTHCVVSTRKAFHRTGRTMCAVVITKADTVLAPFGIGDDRRHDITCPRCMSAHTGLEDVLATDFGFELTYDDRSGRFES